MTLGDQARATVRVEVAPEVAFAVFTEDIDAWWRRGPKYRVAGYRRGTLRLEPGVGGRLVEEIETRHGVRTVHSGTVTVWEPPSRLELIWRGINFAPDESTTVAVTFAPRGDATLVTVTHRGFGALRDDHPVRHGRTGAAFVATHGMWWGELLRGLRAHRRPG